LGYDGIMNKVTHTFIFVELLFYSPIPNKEARKSEVTLLGISLW